MKNKNYKIVLLSDLKNSIDSTLESTISLAKMINGTVTLFHVKEPSELIRSENQLSAKRTINSEFNSTDKKINAMLQSFSKTHDIEMSYSFTFGNPKKEIAEYIKEQRPDMVVLGKKNSRPLNFLGDNLTHALLKEYDGAILIVDDKKTIKTNKKLSLGLLNSLEQRLNVEFAEDIMEHSQKPLKSFKIVKNSGTLKVHPPSNNNIVEYIFEKGDNSIKNLSKYLAKSNIDLLCIERNKSGTKKKDIHKIIGSLNVSMLLADKLKYPIQ